MRLFSSLINEDQVFVVKMDRPSPKSRIRSYKEIFPEMEQSEDRIFTDKKVESKEGSLFIGTAQILNSWSVTDGS
jgi:hypothetical protein